LALRYWKRFLVGLQIRDRIEGYEVEGDNGTHNNTKEAATIEETYDADEMDETNDYEAGGFFPDQETATFAEPTIRRFPQDTVYEDHQNLHLEDMDIESEREDQYVRTLGKGRDMSPAREHRYTSDEIPVEDAAPLWVEGGGFVQESTPGEDVPERGIPAARGYNENTDNTESRSGSDVSITRHQNDTSDGNRMSFDISPNETTTKAPEHREGEDISDTLLHAVAKEGLEESQRTPQIQDLERPGLAELSESRETEMPNAIQDAAAADSPADSTQGSPNDEESVSGETSAVSDMGSLLSHDPEDEDADPDWLM
jgi:xeroderma pigmentosum group C-complementing protein